MHASSLAAEDAFYAAFSANDLAAMMRVWAAGPPIACIHPGGPRLDGVDAIRRSWQAILSEPVRRHFELHARRVLEAGDCRVHLLEEHISVPGTGIAAPPVLATNVYQRLADGWYLVLHHASVAPAPRPATRSPAPGGASPPPLH